MPYKDKEKQRIKRKENYFKNIEREKNTRKKYYLKHRKELILKSENNRKNNLKKYNDIKRRYRKNNKEKIKIYMEKTRIQRRKKVIYQKYKLTWEKYLEILNNQNNLCPICGKSLELTGRDTCVDHCHATNNIRGVLCNNCNAGLGKFKDNPHFLNNAITYLIKIKGEK
jgi:hypothetical protein